MIIVASVSCIYGLGSPEAFFGMLLFFSRGDAEGMDAGPQAAGRTCSTSAPSIDLFRGSFRVRGDVLEILPAYEDVGVRVEYFGDEIERITRFDVLRGDTLAGRSTASRSIPKTHYVTPKDAPGAGHRDHPRGARGAPRRAGGRGQAARSASAWSSAPASTSRC